MSIYLFEGLQGSGKSFHIVKDIIVPAFHKGRPVYSNIKLNPELIEMGEGLVCQISPLLHEIDGDFIRSLPEQNTEEKGRPLDGSIIVIDEIQDYFASTEAMWSKSMLGFLAKHRHQHMDIIIGTQDKWNINKVFRNMVKYHWHFDKLDRFGRKNTYRIDYFQKNDEEPYKKTFENFDKKYFDYYESYDPKSVAKGNIEEPIGEKDNSLYYTAGMIVVSLLVCAYILSRVVDRNANAEESEIALIDPSSEEENIEKNKSSLSSKIIDVNDVVVFNLRGDKVEVKSDAKRTGLVKVGNQYRTIIKDGDKTVIAKSYKLLPFEKKHYRPKPEDFKKSPFSIPRIPRGDREGGIFNNASRGTKSRNVTQGQRGAILEESRKG
jgi:zona occludens toxin